MAKDDLIEPIPGQGKAPEFVPEDVRRPKSNVYTMLLILSFILFAVTIYLAGKELREFYDVRFWFFK